MTARVAERLPKQVYELWLRRPKCRLSIVYKMETRQADASAERLLIRHLPELLNGIDSPGSLSAQLFSRHLIPATVYDVANSYDGSVSTESKRHAICQGLLASVKSEATRLVDFVQAASDHSPAMGDVCAKIKQETLYGELMCLSRFHADC